MTIFTPARIEDAFRQSWDEHTCMPEDFADWSPANPSRGQCGPTALVLMDLLGGELLHADVHVGAERAGGHWWNRLPTGLELDLTREQFMPDEVVGPGRVIPRPSGPPRRCHQQYDLLRRRVYRRLALPTG